MMANDQEKERVNLCLMTPWPGKSYNMNRKAENTEVWRESKSMKLDMPTGRTPVSNHHIYLGIFELSVMFLHLAQDDRRKI